MADGTNVQPADWLDGVTFVHLVVHDTDGEPLDDPSAFHNLRRAQRERIHGNPSFNNATLVGSHRVAE